MADSVIDVAVTDCIAGFLLRYFRAGIRVQTSRPDIDPVRDRDLLRLHWAVSPAVQDLAVHVLRHRHEIQTVLATALRIEDSVIRGRIDARATVLHRQMTGHATAVVGHEPLRSYDSGPNHLLVWVLTQAWSLASRFSAMLPESAGYSALVDSIVQDLDQVRRINAIAQMAGQAWATRRPGSGAVAQAGKSRREVYRKARTAYEALLRIEAGDPEAITAMLRETLLGPLEPWRRYELAVAFGLAEALGKELNRSLSLNLLVGNNRAPIVRVGRYGIFWQTQTALAQDPKLEPSEIVTNGILSAYGMSPSSDRPDLVMIDDEAKRVTSVIEVKYLTGEDASDRVRGAVAQLVRYARLYHAIDDTGPLLGRSLVAVSQGIEAAGLPDAIPLDAPLIVDFAAIQLGQLSEWLHRLH